MLDFVSNSPDIYCIYCNQYFFVCIHNSDYWITYQSSVNAIVSKYMQSVVTYICLL